MVARIRPLHSSCVSNPHAFACCTTSSSFSLFSPPSPSRPSSPAIPRRLTCREASVVVARFVPLPPSREETPGSSLPSLGCERHNAGGDRCREGKRPSRSHGWDLVDVPVCGEDTPSPARGWVWTLPRNPIDKLPSDVGGAGKQVRCIGCDEEVGCTIICGTGTCPGRRRRKDGSMLVRGIHPFGRDPNTTSKRRVIARMRFIHACLRLAQQGRRG